MKILFLTIGRFDDIESKGIYPDLLRYFRNQGHDIYVITHHQRRENLPTELNEKKGAHILSVRIGNITKCGIIEKGISTLTIESKYKRAIKKYFNNVKFDLVMYSTPPITLNGAVEYVKKRDDARTYLLLKDIFPQNAVDLGMINKKGIGAPLYSMFRKKEKKLYRISDYIGCMSQANVDYVLQHNPEVASNKVEVCPNCIEPLDMSVTASERENIRRKYNIPLDKTVFVYGGNLGRPQGISFLIECLKSQKDNKIAYFLIVGDGTEYEKISSYVNASKQENVKLMKRLPKEDYEKMVAACDVGMIFLDYRFTIPNFPSRLLSYMQAEIPILACTDSNTDIGRVIVDGEFGWWCESSEIKTFHETIKKVCESDLKTMGKKGYQYLVKNYNSKIGYEIIMKAYGNKDE